MNETLFYSAISSRLALKLTHCFDAQIQTYRIDVLDLQTDQSASQGVSDLEMATAIFRSLCDQAKAKITQHVKLPRNAVEIIGDLRQAINAGATSEKLHELFTDPEVIELRHAIRAAASATTMADSIIRSYCTQLDREIREQEKLAEVKTYENNEAFGAF